LGGEELLIFVNGGEEENKLNERNIFEIMEVSRGSFRG
jgi:hypothetical protein